MHKNRKSLDEQQKAELGIGFGIFRGLAISFLPKWMQEQYLISHIISKKVRMLQKKIGKEKSDELINQFKNEAIAGREVNHKYILRKIDEAIGTHDL